MTMQITATPNRKARRDKKFRRGLRPVAAALALGVGGGTVAATVVTTPAFADSGAVGGTLRCSSNPWGRKVTGLWTWTNTSGGRWDRYSGTQVAAGYGRDLNIPSGGQLLHYDLYCNGAFAQHGSFWIRPGWNNRNITA